MSDWLSFTITNPAKSRYFVKIAPSAIHSIQVIAYNHDAADVFLYGIDGPDQKPYLFWNGQTGQMGIQHDWNFEPPLWRPGGWMAHVPPTCFVTVRYSPNQPFETIPDVYTAEVNWHKDPDQIAPVVQDEKIVPHERRVRVRD